MHVSYLPGFYRPIQLLPIKIFNFSENYLIFLKTQPFVEKIIGINEDMITFIQTNVGKNTFWTFIKLKTVLSEGKNIYVNENAPICYT